VEPAWVARRSHGFAGISNRTVLTPCRSATSRVSPLLRGIIPVGRILEQSEESTTPRRFRAAWRGFAEERMQKRHKTASNRAIAHPKNACKSNIFLNISELSTDPSRVFTSLDRSFGGRGRIFPSGKGHGRLLAAGAHLQAPDAERDDQDSGDELKPEASARRVFLVEEEGLKKCESADQEGERAADFILHGRNLSRQVQLGVFHTAAARFDRLLGESLSSIRYRRNQGSLGGPLFPAPRGNSHVEF